MKDFLEVIGQSNLLDSDVFTSLKEMKDELLETIDKSQMFRTRTEMEVSVLNSMKHPTSASKYWQSMREQNVHFHELMMLSFEYRKKFVRCKILKRKIENEEDEYEKQLLEIELEENQFVMLNQVKMARARVREIKAWSEIKLRESDKMTYEELEDVDNHQLLSYTARWIKQRIMLGDKGSQSERSNLLGQLRSGILACIEKGLFDKLMDLIPTEYVNTIKNEYSDKLKNIETKKRYSFLQPVD